MATAIIKKCSKCNRELPHIDHDHNTSEVRGLLCQHCNTGLGMFRDRQDLLLKAKEYLDDCLIRLRN